MKRTFFVTGGDGFVGRHLCRLLLENGHEVRALSRRHSRPLEEAGCRVVLGDLRSRGDWEDALCDVEYVIHCAGNARFGNGPQYAAENVGTTRNLIDAVKATNLTLKKFVLVSTIGAVDRAPGDPCVDPLTEESTPSPTSDYGRSKLRSEDMVKASGLPFSIIRPAMVVGPDMRFDSHFSAFARKALVKSVVSRIAWPGAFSVIHVDDLANALLAVAVHPDAQGQIYFCAGERFAVSACFELSTPNSFRLPIAWAAVLARPFVRWLPFALKAMLFDALTASDQRLRALGWQPRLEGSAALSEVVSREQTRVDIERDPAGLTVITGAASGLGRALVELLAPLRARLLLLDRDHEGLASLASRFPHCRFAVVDLGEVGEVDALLRGEVWNEHPITELFACAGFGLRGHMVDIPLQSHRQMFGVNVLARLALALSAMESMRRAQFGRIVFISSSSAFQPLPFMATYAATNSALLSLGEAWSSEVATQGIQVMVVCPGGMQTNFQKSGGVKEVEGEKLMSPSDVARSILAGLGTDQMTLVVSFRSFAMSLLARVLPRRTSVRLWGKLMEKMR